MSRLLAILRHPWRWAIGACFICGELMLFDNPWPIGNRDGFCLRHGQNNSGRPVAPKDGE